MTTAFWPVCLRSVCTLPLQKHHSGVRTCSLRCVFFFFFLLIWTCSHNQAIVGGQIHCFDVVFLVVSRIPRDLWTRAPQRCMNLQLVVCFLFLFIFFLIRTCSHNRAIVAVQVRHFEVVFLAVSRRPRDLVAHGLWPLIRAKYYISLYLRPMHDVGPNAVLWTFCDLVARWFSPVVWAKSLHHRPLHDGSSLLQWHVPRPTGASWFRISQASMFLSYQRKRAHNRSTQVAATST